MSHLTELATFVSIVRHGSFRAASRELGITPSATSLALKRLETRLNLKLINRSTRSMSLTEVGRRLFDDLSVAFANINRSVDNLSDFRDKPTGHLRIVAARTAARYYLTNIVTNFVREYPGMKVEIYAEDALTTLSDDNFDAGIRLGGIVPEHMVKVPIGDNIRFTVVATEEYWKKNTIPLSPQMLNKHNCIVFRFPSSKKLYQWEFSNGKTEYNFDAEGNVVVNDLDIELDLVLKGVGVGYLLFVI